MSGRWDEQEMEGLFLEISETVPCLYSEIQGHIFHTKDNPTAEAIVNRMLSYKKVSL